MRRRRSPLALALVIALAAAGTFNLAGSALAAPGRASLTQLESQLMCVACHESLAVAQSPEAFSERQYIRDLIAQGETAAEIKRNTKEGTVDILLKLKEKGKQSIEEDREQVDRGLSKAREERGELEQPVYNGSRVTVPPRPRSRPD